MFEEHSRCQRNALRSNEALNRNRAGFNPFLVEESRGERLNFLVSNQPWDTACGAINPRPFLIQFISSTGRSETLDGEGRRALTSTSNRLAISKSKCAGRRTVPFFYADVSGSRNSKRVGHLCLVHPSRRPQIPHFGSQRQIEQL